MKMEINLQSIRVPNFILSKMPPGKREDGFKEGPKWSLSEIPAEILSTLCDEFRANVFEKADKIDPKILMK